MPRALLHNTRVNWRPIPAYDCGGTAKLPWFRPWLFTIGRRAAAAIAGAGCAWLGCGGGHTGRWRARLSGRAEHLPLRDGTLTVTDTMATRRHLPLFVGEYRCS